MWKKQANLVNNQLPTLPGYLLLGEREREKFCVINVKYKEISWRVRRRRRGGGGKK